MYPTWNVLRLLNDNFVLLRKRIYTCSFSGLKQQEHQLNRTRQRDFESLLEKHKDKITFSSYLEYDKVRLGYHRYYVQSIKQVKREAANKMEIKARPSLPLALQYYVDKERLLVDKEDEACEDEPDKQFHLPFANATELNTHPGPDHIPNKEMTTEEFNRTDIDKWMTSYEHFDDTKLLYQPDSDEEDYEHEDDVSDWSKYYGTPDPAAGVSTVPCGGCGALLHCSDHSIPGYLPSEIYKGRSVEELKTMECQRCHFLREYNIALDVSVDPKEYEQLLQSIRHVKSLVVMIVDLLDMPCSIWPDIVDIIGPKRPIIIVGNKVDLLPADSIGYMKRVKESLMAEIRKTKLKEANIKHVSLISAKNGYGVEELISAMFKVWLCKGDVFLIGCTNVGKSSLFNALLQSDYCKVQAQDLVKRATVSRWPGTTLNLLKFPINRISGWKMYTRTKRLQAEAKILKMEAEIRDDQSEGKTKTLPTLIGHIGRSYSNPDIFRDDTSFLDRPAGTTLNERDELFKQSKWLYDTPGVVHPDQVLSFFTTEELLDTIPRQTISPRTYYLFQGHSIFIGGIARLDFTDCEEACRFTVFASYELPITVTRTEEACEVYETFLGTELFNVPRGGEERLSQWPGLQKHPQALELVGKGPKECCGDIVLSSVGWVAVTTRPGAVCEVVAWTPQARGVHLRYPSLLPFAVTLKGKRVRDTPAYRIGPPFCPNK